MKYYTEGQIKQLRRAARDKALLARTKNTITPIREWMAIDLLTCTGIRASEVAGLCCGDLSLSHGESAVHVRAGKGGKARTVEIPGALKKHLKSFIRWKIERGEPTGTDDCLFLGQRGPWTDQAVRQVVKKYLKELNLYEPGKAVHALRHSYAVALYRRQRDLRAVQIQLGHANIQTTQIYADVLKEDIQRQIHGLWQ